MRAGVAMVLGLLVAFTGCGGQSLKHVDDSGGAGSSAAGRGQGGTGPGRGGGVCDGPAHSCDYNPEGCLCRPVAQNACSQLEIACAGLPPERRDLTPASSGGACDGPDCPQAIVVPTSWTCSCNQNAWSCSQ